MDEAPARVAATLYEQLVGTLGVRTPDTPEPLIVPANDPPSDWVPGKLVVQVPASAFEVCTSVNVAVPDPDTLLVIPPVQVPFRDAGSVVPLHAARSDIAMAQIRRRFIPRR